jgi:hypothetical protein
LKRLPTKDAPSAVVDEDDAKVAREIRQSLKQLIAEWDKRERNNKRLRSSIEIPERALPLGLDRTK